MMRLFGSSNIALAALTFSPKSPPLWEKYFGLLEVLALAAQQLKQGHFSEFMLVDTSHFA